MRIAHVVGTFPPQIGGMGRVVFDEATALVKNGHQVSVFTLDYRVDSQAASIFSFPVIRLKTFIKWGDAGFVPRLLFKLREFDLVHLHYPFYGGAEFVYLAKVFFGKKYIVTYHMDAAPTQSGKKCIKKVYDAVWARRIFKNAEKVAMVDDDHFQTAALSAAVPPERRVFLPNAVDTTIFYSAQARRECIVLRERFVGKKIMLFVGNLLPVKRLDLLLQALTKISDHNIVLLVVGGGYAESNYKALAKSLGLVNQVFFLGQSHDACELARYYALADVVVIPSESESFSLVALEALATGCPVVAADITGLRGRIADGRDGILFTPRSVDSLACALQTILEKSHEERKAMGEAGRKKVVEQYSLEKHVNILETIYRAVV